MIRFTRRSFAAGVAGLAVTSILPATSFGQGEATEILSQIPGLESAYARRYDPADSHSHIEIDGAPIEVTEETPDNLVILALAFESAATLQGVMGFMLSTETAGLLLSDSTTALTEGTVADLPAGNTLYTGVNDGDEYISLLVLPIAETAYLITVRGESDANQVTANAIGAFLVEQEPADSPVVVESEGIATGGPFDVFPGVDDTDLLNGLIPMFDYDLLVSNKPIMPSNATPAASPAA